MTIVSTAKHSITNSNIDTKSLFQKAIGDKFYDMPPRLRELHGPDASKTWVGEARTQAGETWLARFISRTIGFGVPSSQDRGAYERIEVTFERSDNSEKWQRDFNGHCFNSHFAIGTKKQDERVNYFAIEKFGLFNFELDLIVKKQRLYFVVRRCTFLKLPLPAFLLPKGDSYEYEHNDRFHFKVEVRVPIAGLIAAYDGWLSPVEI